MIITHDNWWYNARNKQTQIYSIEKNNNTEKNERTKLALNINYQKKAKKIKTRREAEDKKTYMGTAKDIESVNNGKPWSEPEQVLSLLFGLD